MQLKVYKCGMISTDNIKLHTWSISILGIEVVRYSVLKPNTVSSVCQIIVLHCRNETWLKKVICLTVRPLGRAQQIYTCSNFLFEFKKHNFCSSFVFISLLYLHLFISLDIFSIMSWEGGHGLGSCKSYNLILLFP